MTQLFFGTAGIPNSAQSDTILDGIKRIAELGLGCMEMEFVHGVKLNEAGARLVAEVAADQGVKLSSHAPYYINFNAHEPAKLIASKQRLLRTAQISSLCGAQSVVFHTAFFLGDPPDEAYITIKKTITEVLDQIKHKNIRIQLRPEVMGKHSQFGTVEEVIKLCSELEGLAPCIDFSHWHAYTGVNNSYSEFVSVLQQVETGLGRAALDDIHIHCSGIKYGAKGELKHLNLEESDFQYAELIKALKDYEVKGMLKYRKHRSI